MSVTYTCPRERAVIAWDHANVHRRCARQTTLPEAKAVLGHVFQLAGIAERAPVVIFPEPDSDEYVPGVDAYVTQDGLKMALQTNRSTSVILHEASHLLTDDPLSVLECRQPVERAMHGPVWLTNYLALLDRLMGPSFNTFYLRSTMPAIIKPEELGFSPIVRGKRLVNF